MRCMCKPSSFWPKLGECLSEPPAPGQVRGYVRFDETIALMLVLEVYDPAFAASAPGPGRKLNMTHVKYLDLTDNYAYNLAPAEVIERWWPLIVGAS